MGTDLEQALREGMDRFTEPVTAPAGLAVRAYRQRRRRRFARRATAAGTATAAIAAAVALSLGHGSPARPPRQAQTAAVVLRQVEAAVGANVIEHSDTALSASRQSVIDLVWGDGVSVMPGSRWAVTRLEAWSYGHRYLMAGYTAGGQRVVDETGTVTGTRLTATNVIYPVRQWSHRITTVTSGDSCPAYGPLLDLTPPGGWPAAIRALLACGGFRIAGRQTVNGVNAIKVTDAYAGGSHETLWVDPASYLPVRMELVLAPGFAERSDISWLRPTARNLAALTISVPAGFRQVPPVRP
jgi:hypothetical protein